MLPGLEGAVAPLQVIVAALLVTIGALYWWFQWRIGQLHEREAALSRQMATLGELWAVAEMGGDLSRDVLAQCLEVVTSRFPLQALMLWRIEAAAEGDRLGLFAAAHQRVPWHVTEVPMSLLRRTDTTVSRAMESGELVVTRLEGDHLAVVPGALSPQALAVPIQVGGGTWGCLVATRDERDPRWSGGDRQWFRRLGEQFGLLIATGEQAALRQRAEAYRALAQYRSEFVANISHDLRTPLGLIRGYASTLRRSGDRLTPEERREFLGVIDEAGRDLAGMIDRLLALSYMESEGLSLRTEPVDARSFLAERVHHVLEASGAENIQVDLALEPGLVVWVDRTWFPSVVDNVLENAIKYGRAPYRVTGGRKGESVVLEVEDRGPGASPDELSRLFERFYRGSQNRLTKAGTGLGLSIARRIVEAHGGTIAAHLPEGGFAVRVVLPVRPPAPSAAVPEEPAALAAPEGEVP